MTALQLSRVARDFGALRTRRDPPIEPGMTIGIVAHAYAVPTAALQEALGRPRDQEDIRTLERIAADRHVPFPVIRANLQVAIAAARAPRHDIVR